MHRCINSLTTRWSTKLWQNKLCRILSHPSRKRRKRSEARSSSKLPSPPTSLEEAPKAQYSNSNTKSQPTSTGKHSITLRRQLTNSVLINNQKGLSLKANLNLNKCPPLLTQHTSSWVIPHQSNSKFENNKHKTTIINGENHPNWSNKKNLKNWFRIVL